MTERSPLDRDLTARMLTTALEEARAGLREGGIPIGAALFTREGDLLGSGHNRRVQENDASIHAETDAFRRAGRRRHYGDTVMVTTLSPCWYCSGLVRQFNIGAVVIGESANFHGGHDWLRELGVEVIVLNDPACTELLGTFIHEHPELWNSVENAAIAAGLATLERLVRAHSGADEAAHALMLAQATMWVPFTIVVGALFAVLGAFTVRGGGDLWQSAPARLLRGGPLPAGGEPRLHMRPLGQIDRQRAIERGRDVEIGNRKIGAGEPLLFLQRVFEHVERRAALAPRFLGDLGLALVRRQLARMALVIDDLAIEPAEVIAEERDDHVAAVAFEPLLHHRSKRSALDAAGHVDVKITDARGEPVTGLALSGSIGRPSDARSDAKLSFAEVGRGAYRAAVASAQPGTWMLSVDARPAGNADEAPLYRIKRRLWLTP